MVKDKDFKGYIHDVGGPTANFRHPACEKQLSKGACGGRQCLYPTPCKNMNADHSDYVALLRKLRKLPGVKKVFVRSGIRFDYLLADKKDTFFRELVQYHISGQLKVAPEHVSDAVLARMGKPKNAVYNQFVEKYFALNRQYGMNQYLVPYLMSSHPGSTLKEAVELAEYIRDMGYNPEQVQDFYPTPSTLSTVMYCTGLDPRTMERVYVPTDPHEKAMAAGADPVPRPEKLRPRAGSAGEGAPGGFDRFRCKVSHPFRAAPFRAKKAGTVKRKTQAVQVKKHAATLVCLKWQRVFTFFYTGTFRKQSRFPHRIAAFPPDTSPYPRPDLGKRCRIPASHALL